MQVATDWTNLIHHEQLDVDFLQAFYVEHAFPKHSHDYYVICLIQRGVQSFTHKGAKLYTPPGGVIFINPDVAHTGEPADEKGFRMLALYPTIAHMQAAAYELTGKHQIRPFFKDVRVDHPWVLGNMVALHDAVQQNRSPLEIESRFTWTLAQMLKRYGDVQLKEQKLRQERFAIRQARHFIEEHFAEGIKLAQLAEHVALSPYYFLRVFGAEVGMPPHAYLESVRIRQAQYLIRQGQPLIDVAVDVGFSSQSHLTSRFKKIIGVTPGQYAQQL